MSESWTLPLVILCYFQRYAIFYISKWKDYHTLYTSTSEITINP
jgi:hypothetical protein